MRQVVSRLLFEDAAEEIRQAIYNGAYQPGERLNEVEIARNLNLSRGPVREAIRKLEQDGLLVSEPQRGARVIELRRRDALDALAIRELAETLAVDETISIVADHDFEVLDEIVNQLRLAEADGSFTEIVNLDHAFHERLMLIAATPTAMRSWRSVAEQNRMCQAIGNTVWMPSGLIATSHQKVLDALRSLDAQALADATHAHVDESRVAVLNQLAD